MDQATLLCLWATELRKSLADPNCPDNARGACVGPQNEWWGVPSFLDDEGPWAPDRLPAGASSTSLKAALPLENRKRRCVSVEDGRPGKTGAGTENFFSVT